MKRVPWTIHRRRRVRELLRQGKTRSQVADALGCTTSALNDAVYRYQLDVPPADLVPVTELVAPLGYACLRSLMKHAHDQKWPLRKWGGHHPCVPESFAMKVLEERETRQLVTERPPGMVTRTELALRWGYHPTSLQPKLRRIPFILWNSRQPGGLTRLYAERDVAHLAPPVAPTCAPRGYVSTQELAELTDMKRSGIKCWVKTGCPHIRLRQNRLAFNPQEVAAWLCASRFTRQRRLGQWLTSYLNQQGTAA